jgi:hypothetical protein
MQTWTNLLNYFKRNMGAKLNLLEMSDEEIIEGIQEDVIPLFSQYSSNKKFCLITESNRIPFTIDSGDTQWVYELPIDINEYVIDIFEIYIDTGSLDDPFYNTKYSGGNIGGSLTSYGRGSTDTYGGGMIDQVIDNEFLNALRYLSRKNTWEYFPPKTIRFDSQINTAIVIYETSHSSLDTIDPDMFNIVFKPLCLGYVMRWIVALRAKYENLATPMGEVRVNWQKLEADSEKLINDATEKLENILPDNFIEIV